MLVCTITYKKNEKLQVVENPKLLKSLARQDDKNFKLLIFINDEVETSDKEELQAVLDHLNLSGCSSVIELSKNPIPIARNKALEILNSQNEYFIFPDDDDELYDYHSIRALNEVIRIYKPKLPVVYSFEGLSGKIMPNPALNRDFRNAYREALGYVNWNFLFHSSFFFNNHLSFPEFMKAPYKNHDTALFLKMLRSLKGKPIDFLVNPIIDYKFPDNGPNISKNKRPDSNLYYGYEYLIQDAKMEIGRFLHYNSFTARLSEISEDSYRGLKFRKDTSRSDRFLGYHIAVIAGNYREVEVVDHVNSSGLDVVKINLGGFIGSYRVESYSYVNPEDAELKRYFKNRELTKDKSLLNLKSICLD